MQDNIAQAAQAMQAMNAQGLTQLTGVNVVKPPATLASHLARLKTLAERAQASASRAGAAADNLAGSFPSAGSADNKGDPEPAGLINQMGKVMTAMDVHLERLDLALDRIDRAHG